MNAKFWQCVGLVVALAVIMTGFALVIPCNYTQGIQS